jgi:hypothetical protein
MRYLIWLCCCQNDAQSTTALYSAAGNNAEAAVDYFLSIKADFNKLCHLIIHIVSGSLSFFYERPCILNIVSREILDGQHCTTRVLKDLYQLQRSSFVTVRTRICV